MSERNELEIERSNMRFVSRGLQLKVGAMMLLYGALILFLFNYIFFPEVAYTIDFVRYALGTLLGLTMVDFTGRLLCWKWPKDQSAILAVIGSTVCQLGSVVVLVLGLIESTSSSLEPEAFVMTISVYLLLVVGTQAASAVLFMGYTGRICGLLGQDKLVWRPTLVLAAYGLSGIGAVTLVIVLLFLAIVAFCGGFLGAWIIFTTLPFRLVVSILVLILVFFPFRSYGWFLYELAQAIEQRRSKREGVESQFIKS